MSLPLLWFTLGALIGLPVGWWLGWVYDPLRAVMMAIRYALAPCQRDADMALIEKYLTSHTLKVTVPV